jgi:hypothetical protein
MSFKVKLKVGSTEVNVLDVSYSLHQETDATGRPSSVARGGKITVTIESTGSQEWLELMFNNFDRKDGTITFFKRDTDAKLKELSFKEAYIVDYKETFQSTGSTPLTETFTFSAESLSTGNAEFKNNWV